MIPCFNSENSINELINNIFSEVDDFIEFDLAEIICVDDCSKDGTKNIIKNIQNKRDKVLYLSFATTSKTNDDYNVYIISPGTIEKITRSPIDGVIRYDIRGEDWPHPEKSTKKYIKLNV